MNEDEPCPTCNEVDWYRTAEGDLECNVCGQYVANDSFPADEEEFYR